MVALYIHIKGEVVTMKKKLAALFAMITMLASILPSVFAAPSDYVGAYYTGNTDGTGGASMDILTCTDSTITIRFMRIKNDVETYKYIFSEGTVNGDTAVIPCHMINTVSGSEFDGKAVLTLGNMVKVQITSSLGAEIYTGTLPKVTESHFTDNTGTQPTPPPVTSPEPSDTEITESATVVLNGTVLEFEEDAQPYIIDNFTYVPLRSVFSSMGINVYWDEYQKNNYLNEQLITCTKNDIIIQFARTFNSSGYNVWSLRKWVNSDTSKNDAVSIDIAALQPEIIGERSYVPLRVISEAFGATVDWINDTNTVNISCDTANSYWYPGETIGAMEDFTLDNARSYIPSDYSSTVPISTPYFAPESKFYLFDSIDAYGPVKVKIYYGGYIVVNAVEKPAETENPTQAPKQPSAAPTAAPDGNTEASPAPEDATTPPKQVFTFDLTDDAEKATDAPSEPPAETSDK